MNKEPLPALPESYGIRLPPEGERLTALNFELVPKPKPDSKAKTNGVSTGDQEDLTLGEAEDESNLFGGSDAEMDGI